MPDWNANTYLLIERLLFDLDDVIRRQMGVSTLPATVLPRETDRALRESWGLCLDAARILQDEKQRLELAKVAYDRVTQ